MRSAEYLKILNDGTGLFCAVEDVVCSGFTLPSLTQDLADKVNATLDGSECCIA